MTLHRCEGMAFGDVALNAARRRHCFTKQNEIPPSIDFFRSPVRARLKAQRAASIRSDALGMYMHGSLRGLLLDFDGTIAETERFGQRVAYNLAFDELGLDWIWDEVLYGELLSVAGGKERLRYYIDRYKPELRDDAGITSLIHEIHAAKIRHFARIAPGIPLRPGVFRLMKEAHSAGVAVAIATTASKPGVEALLGQHPDLPAMISLIAANEAVERKKPAPDVYLWALERLGMASEDCVAIEDSNVGLRAALAARLPTLITISDYTSTDDFTGASAIVTGLGEPDANVAFEDASGSGRGMIDLEFLESIVRRASGLVG